MLAATGAATAAGTGAESPLDAPAAPSGEAALAAAPASGIKLLSGALNFTRAVLMGPSVLALTLLLSVLTPPPESYAYVAVEVWTWTPPRTTLALSDCVQVSLVVEPGKAAEATSPRLEFFVNVKLVLV